MPLSLSRKFHATLQLLRYAWILLLVAPPAVWSQFTYTTNNGTLTLTVYRGSDWYLTIPDSIYGMPVTGIGDSVFSEDNSLYVITIGTNVTSIGNNCFYNCSSLTSVSLPNSITNLGTAAFLSCSSLTNINIPTNLSVIAPLAFELCSRLTSLTIPNSVITIGDSAFADCNNLANLTISNGVKSIAHGAFAGCLDFTNVTIPQSVTNVGAGAFGGCPLLMEIAVDPRNTVYSTSDGVLFDKSQTTLVECPGGKAGSYVIPSGVLNIGDEAFEQCFRLTDITIPSGVTNIGNSAFYACNLTNVVIPEGVKALGSAAFSYCTSLTNVTLPNSLLGIGDSAFYGCGALAKLSPLTSVISIGNWAFRGCFSLADITVGRSLTRIGDAAFLGCNSLLWVWFQGNSPTVLGSNIFDGSYSVTVYYLPGTTGWGTTFANRPTGLWNPVIQANAPGFGVLSNSFCFSITGPANQIIVIEACTNLAMPTWFALQTNVLIGGSTYFSDPAWTNAPARFYRLQATGVQ